MNDFPTVISIGGYLVGVAGATVMLFSRVKNENLKDLQERVRILESERSEAREQHVANREAIGALQGKLDAYKEVPLKFIPEALEQLIKSNNLILETLQSSAITLSAEKHGGGLLVKTTGKKPLDVKPVKE